jgi:CheY-like chemotaxis protein
MFFRKKVSGNYTYLQIVKSKWEDGVSKQRVFVTLGRLDRLVATGDLKSLVESSANFLPAAGGQQVVPSDFEAKPDPRRIFVVDDDPQVLRGLRRTFATFSDRFEIDGSNDGIEALVRIGIELPDVVLLDIYMEGIDGFEVCRRLRRMPYLENVVIVAMTAFPTDDVRARIMDAGAAAYLAKPVTPEQLVALLDSLPRPDGTPKNSDNEEGTEEKPQAVAGAVPNPDVTP